MEEINNNQKTSFFQSILLWLDSDREYNFEEKSEEKIDWIRAVPFIGFHLACLAVFFVGISWMAVSVAIFLYFLRMFAITGFYHRYFSHRSFKTSRFMQAIFAMLGTMAIQKGPLWWAAHHRHHHLHSDDDDDAHSPAKKGFWWSHTGWFLAKSAHATHYKRVADFNKYPELRFFNRFDLVSPVILAILVFAFGALLSYLAPGLGTSSWQMLVWGFFVSTVCVYHGTFFINSLAHRMGNQRYKTGDDSRNSLILALITLGEGWHNNHHHYCASTRQGFFWWEIDITYYILRFMSWFGLIWDLNPVPDKIKQKDLDV